MEGVYCTGLPGDIVYQLLSFPRKKIYRYLHFYTDDEIQR